MRKNPLVRLGLGLCVALAAFASQPSRPARGAPRAFYSVDVPGDSPFLNACTVLPNDCSLRGAVNKANSLPGSTITFSGTHDITLNSPLNLTAAGTLIDSQGLQVSIHLSTTPTVAGNVFKISAEGVILRGLTINGSSAGAANIWVTGASTKNVVIQSNRIGRDQDSFCASPASSDGIYIDATGTPGAGEYLVTIDANAISCIPSGDGVEINNARKVMVSQNAISGAVNGIWVNQGKDNTLSQNRIGSNTTGVRITGNGANDATSATGNVVSFSDIACNFGCGGGLDTGNVGGVLIENGAFLNTIGSAMYGQENAIFNNTAYGIRVVDSNQNYIGGNFIGATQNPVEVYSNLNGIELLNASGTVIGPLGSSFPGNLISGNNGHGILLGAGTRNTTIVGNIIGPNFALTGTLPNFGSGIRIEAGANSNFIGGNDASPRGLAARPDDNIIGGNFNHGVLIAGATTTSNTVGGNQIGYFDNMGTIIALGNPSDGVRLEGSGGGNRVIGAALAYNVNGIYLNNSGSSTILNSPVYSSVAHGVLLTGALTVSNTISGGYFEGNGKDGISQSAGWGTGNVWWPVRVRGNGGLEIDLAAVDEDANAVSLPIPSITDFDYLARVLTGTVPATLGSGFIRIYGTRLADRDPSGYGGGTDYLFSVAFSASAFSWSGVLLPDEVSAYPCFTVLAEMYDSNGKALGSTEFSNTVCRSTAFVPAVVR